LSRVSTAETVVAKSQFSVEAIGGAAFIQDVDRATRGTFVLICHDYAVPSRAADVNQGDREVPASLRRVDFFQWLPLDIPETTRENYRRQPKQRHQAKR
jgi:phosphatidylethanolamine-binding protein (PEBP) family uncharacterized protein